MFVVGIALTASAWPVSLPIDFGGWNWRPVLLGKSRPGFCWPSGTKAKTFWTGKIPVAFVIRAFWNAQLEAKLRIVFSSGHF